MQLLDAVQASEAEVEDQDAWSPRPLIVGHRVAAGVGNGERIGLVGLPTERPERSERGPLAKVVGGFGLDPPIAFDFHRLGDRREFCEHRRLQVGIRGDRPKTFKLFLGTVLLPFLQSRSTNTALGRTCPFPSFTADSASLIAAARSPASASHWAR